MTDKDDQAFQNSDDEAPAGRRCEPSGRSSPSMDPVAQPQLALMDKGLTLRLDTTLAADETVTGDTRPWVRSVLRRRRLAGGTLRGAALADFRSPVGRTVLHYSGTDLSGQSRCTVRRRDACATP